MRFRQNQPERVAFALLQRLAYRNVGIVSLKVRKGLFLSRKILGLLKTAEKCMLSCNKVICHWGKTAVPQ